MPAPKMATPAAGPCPLATMKTHPANHGDTPTQALVQWCNAQFLLGMPPGLQGGRLRCQYITNATPALVLLTVLLYLGLFSLAGVPDLVRSSLLTLPIPVAGVLWFRHQQHLGRMPSYWMACLVCQATVLTGIVGGQGTAIDSHGYFLFFALTAPLVVPVAHRLALAAISLECLAAYLLLETRGWPAAPSVQGLDPEWRLLLRLSVIVCCSAILFAATLVSELLLAGLERKVVELAHTDPLTGLPNRRQFHVVLDEAMARSTRSQTPLCLAIIDIDHFKAVNDRHGHTAGDEVLEDLALRLQAAKRKVDLLARIGGEEFALVMEDTSPPQALVALERLRRAVADQPIPLGNGHRLEASVSMGVAAWQAGSSDRALMEAADQALYAAKRAGRNRVCTALAEAVRPQAAADAAVAQGPKNG